MSRLPSHSFFHPCDPLDQLPPPTLPLPIKLSREPGMAALRHFSEYKSVFIAEHQPGRRCDLDPTGDGFAGQVCGFGIAMCVSLSGGRLDRTWESSPEVARGCDRGAGTFGSVGPH